MSLNQRLWHWSRRMHREVCTHVLVSGGTCETTSGDMEWTSCDLNGDWLHPKRMIAVFNPNPRVDPRVCHSRFKYAAWEERCPYLLWSCDLAMEFCRS